MTCERKINEDDYTVMPSEDNFTIKIQNKHTKWREYILDIKSVDILNIFNIDQNKKIAFMLNIIKDDKNCYIENGKEGKTLNFTFKIYLSGRVITGNEVLEYQYKVNAYLNETNLDKYIQEYEKEFFELNCLIDKQLEMRRQKKMNFENLNLTYAKNYKKVVKG